MEKYFNSISVAGSMIAGFFYLLYGGWNFMMRAIILMAVLDYLTGVIRAIINRQFSSEVGSKGIMKKVLIFVVIAVANIVQGLIGDAIPLREIVIMFYICNEALSLIENIAEFLPIPDQLKNVLIQLRDSESKSNGEEHGENGN